TPQVLRRRGVDHQRRPVERSALIVRRAQRRGERLPGEEASVLVAFVDRLGDIRLVRPDHCLVPVRRKQVGERRTPRAGSDDRAAHQANRAAMSTASTMTSAHATVAPGPFGAGPSAPPAAVLRLPKRCSSPFRQRTMFARCVQNTKSAMMTLTAKIGDRTPTVIARSTGRIVALVNEPSDT